jgi:hypothetical protein
MVIICSDILFILLKWILPAFTAFYGKLCQFLRMNRVRVRIDADAIPNGIVKLTLLKTLMANAALLL